MTTPTKREYPALPEWAPELSKSHDPIDVFVANNEPAGDDEQQFREELASVIKRVADPLLDEIERLKADGPVMRRGSLGDGSDWMGTMRECLEDAREAARVEAALGDEARAEVKELRATIERQRGVIERLQQKYDTRLPDHYEVLGRHPGGYHLAMEILGIGYDIGSGKVQITIGLQTEPKEKS